MSYTLPFIEVKGSNYDMGFQHGKICQRQIKDYLGVWTRIVKSSAPGINDKEILNAASKFITFIKEETPELDEEIRGLADGSEITIAEAYALQIRFELLLILIGNRSINSEPSCTSFAIEGKKSVHGLAMCGQNVDAQADIENYGIMLRSTPKNGPSMLIYTSVGQIGYIGINSEGIGCYCNMVSSPGWKPGVPRYILLRRILQCTNMDEIMKVFDISRGASMNYTIVGPEGNAICVETTVDDYRVIKAEKGFIVHTNHYQHEDLTSQDELKEILPDTEERLNRANHMLSEWIMTDQRKVDLSMMNDVLSDHDGFPTGICRHVKSNPSNAQNPVNRMWDGFKTITSVISEPQSGETHICVGNPCENKRTTYKL